MTANELEKVIERIQQLLNNHGRTPEEAAAYAAKAQQLMNKYNLDLLTVENHEKRDREFVQEVMQIYKSKRSGLNWRRNLMFVLTRRNFCKAIVVGSTNRMSIVGERHNIDMVKHLFVYLTREIQRLADEGWEKAKYGTLETAIPWKDSFCRGAVISIDSRLYRESQQFWNQTAETQALVLVEDKAVVEAYERFHPERSKMNLGYAKVNQAYQSGIEAGRAIPINRPVEKAGTPVHSLR